MAARERVRFQTTKKQDARNAMAREIRNEIFASTVTPLQVENEKLRERIAGNALSAQACVEAERAQTGRMMIAKDEVEKSLAFSKKMYEESVGRADELQRKLNAVTLEIAEMIRNEGGLMNLEAKAETPGDAVNHPAHYGGDTVYEVIKVLRAWKLGFPLGNAVKYIARAGKKDAAKTIEDLRKAIFYINDEIKALS